MSRDNWGLRWKAARESSLLVSGLSLELETQSLDQIFCTAKPHSGTLVPGPYLGHFQRLLEYQHKECELSDGICGFGLTVGVTQRRDCVDIKWH